LDIETASQQTGVPVVGDYTSIINPGDYTEMTKRTLGVIQLASAWQSTLKGIMLGMDEIKDSLKLLHTTLGEDLAEVFTSWLRLTLHQCNVLLGQLEYIDKRGQAQMEAVSVLTADDRMKVH
jgi:hypothetical protein